MVTGHLRKRTSTSGKVSYQIIVETEKNPANGKRQRFYKTVKSTKREAEAMLNKMIYELENGIESVKSSSSKLSEWMMEWHKLYNAHLSPTTKAGYRKQIETRIIPYLGKIPLNSLSSKIIQEWINNLSSKENLSGKTIKNIFLNLKAALDKAKKLKMIPENPCDNIVLPTVEKYVAQVYDDAEVKEILNKAEGKDIYLLLALDICVGLRRGEISELKWSDIDFENKVIHITRSRVTADSQVFIKDPKSKAGIRNIYYSNHLATILKEEYEKYKEKAKKPGFKDMGYVIYKKNGEPYKPDSISQKWRRFYIANDIKEARFHDLRHTCATLMIAKGSTAKAVQERLGHANIQTTMDIYTHCLASMNKEAGEKIDTIFDS